MRFGSSWNSSSMRTPFGFFAFGLSACSTRSGTITVRAQYEIFDRWNGNQRGSSMTSTGITGTAPHDMTSNCASRMRVNTFTLAAPPWRRIASRARPMCSASGGWPIIFRAK